MTTKTKKAEKPQHGGLRNGAGRKPQPTKCQKCGAVCQGARVARAHCWRTSK